MTRALLVCPGRGSYARESLGSLQGRSPAAQAVIAACDAWRAERGLPSVSELDAAEAFSARKHSAGEHASLLTAACTWADHAELRQDWQVVGVVGNSMGWYTALAVAGALPLDAAIALVDTMGSYQAQNVIGGQLMVPLTDADWTPSPSRVAQVEAALTAARAAGHVADWSIRLGSFAVLGADDGGLAFLKAALPAETRGARTFPAQLPLHSAFHTGLLQPTSERAQADLGWLPFQPPRVPLVDGRGALFRPWSADPAELAAYTLGHQVVRPYDFALSLQVACEHTAPDVIVLLGPGNPLGGPVAASLVHMGWRAMRTRADLDAHQAGDPPLLLSFGVPEQRARLLGA